MCPFFPTNYPIFSSLRTRYSCHTFLEKLEVFPQNVANEGGCPCRKGVFAHGANVLSLHPKLMQRNALQGELLGCPLQPMGHVVFCPLTRICNNESKQLKSSTCCRVAVNTTNFFDKCQEQVGL